MGYMNNDGLLYFWTKLKTIFIRKVNNQTPDANGNVSIDIPAPATANPLMDGTVAVGTSNKYAREDHKHPVDTSRAASSHTHGNITNAGALQTTDVTIANGDKIVVTDSSNSNKVARTSAAFDGSTETKALSKKGTWVDIPQPATANPSMDGTAAVGSSAKFAKEDHVHPHDTSKQDALTFDTTPTSGSTNPVTSGGIAAYVDDAVEGAMGQVVGEIPNASTTTPKMDGTASNGTESAWSRGDHRHPTDTTRAPLDSPVFTGSPEAPTPSNNAYQKEIVTAAWVRTFFARIGVGATSFKGVINSFSDITSTLHYIEKGWYWVVGTAGTYAGQDCEQGDFIYAIDSYLYGTKTISGTSYPYGDANMDGSVTASDAALIGRFLEGLDSLSDNQKALADADGDGAVTANDQELILQTVVDLNVHQAASVPDSAFAIVQTNIIPMTNSEIDTIVAS